ncbi:MAG: ComEC/Rec2 family competence protein, partial [Methylocystaceae bacterium]
MKSLISYKRLVPLVVIVLLITMLVGCQPLPSSSGPTVQETVQPVTQQFSGKLTMWMLDVGQGDCLLFKSPSGRFLLVDGGPTDSGTAVLAALNQLGVKEIDTLIVSHAHEDHIGGLDAVLAKYPAQKAYLPKMTSTTRAYEDMWLRFKQGHTKIVYPQAGTEIPWDQQVKVEVLGPVNDDYEELNDGSLVARLEFGQTSFLLTGDITIPVEEDLLSRGLNPPVTVLKVAHHGSNGSTGKQLLDKIRPKLALISVGQGNDYGHPGLMTINRLKAVGANILRTDQQGTIRLESNGEKVMVYQEKPVPKEKVKLIGNAKSGVWHRSDCGHLPTRGSQVFFNSS